MENAFWLKGMVVGFVLCAPLGPVGVLCLQRTITAGRWAGFFSILGAAMVDGFYGMVAGFGLSIIGNMLDVGKFWFQLFGGGVLVAVGLRLCTAPPVIRTSQGLIRNSLDAFLSTSALMLSNPLPILVISAALSGLTGESLGIDFTDIPRFALGLFLGSLLWSPLLVNASSWIRPMIQPQHLALVNRVCGALIVCCGLALGAASLAAYSM
jgi:threonine/homoserine/homoserine lactone efflux protein